MIAKEDAKSAKFNFEALCLIIDPFTRFLLTIFPQRDYSNLSLVTRHSSLFQISANATMLFTEYFRSQRGQAAE
jgi:hypothetical protein